MLGMLAMLGMLPMLGLGHGLVLGLGHGLVLGLGTLGCGVVRVMNVAGLGLRVLHSESVFSLTPTVVKLELACLGWGY